MRKSEISSPFIFFLNLVEKKLDDKTAKPKPDESKKESKVTAGPAKDTSTSEGVSFADKKEVEGSSKGMTPSLIIGLLLVVPVLFLLIITLVIRAHKSGISMAERFKEFSHNAELSFTHEFDEK